MLFIGLHKVSRIQYLDVFSIAVSDFDEEILEKILRKCILIGIVPYTDHNQQLVLMMEVM